MAALPEVDTDKRKSRKRLPTKRVTEEWSEVRLKDEGAVSIARWWHLTADYRGGCLKIVQIGRLALFNIILLCQMSQLNDEASISRLSFSYIGRLVVEISHLALHHGYT